MPYFPASVGMFIAICCQLVFVLLMWMRRKFRSPNPEQLLTEKILTVMHVLSILDYIICGFAVWFDAENDWLIYPWVASFLRPFKYCLMTSTVRNYMRRYLNVLKVSLIMFVFI